MRARKNKVRRDDERIVYEHSGSTILKSVKTPSKSPVVETEGIAQAPHKSPRDMGFLKVLIPEKQQENLYSRPTVAEGLTKGQMEPGL